MSCWPCFSVINRYADTLVASSRVVLRVSLLALRSYRDCKLLPHVVFTACRLIRNKVDNRSHGANVLRMESQGSHQQLVLVCHNSGLLLLPIMYVLMLISPMLWFIWQATSVFRWWCRSRCRNPIVSNRARAPSDFTNCHISVSVFQLLRTFWSSKLRSLFGSPSLRLPMFLLLYP